MKKVIFIALSLLAIATACIVLTSMAFCFAWGWADYSAGNISDFTGGWFLFLLMLVIGFLVPFFACRSFGRLWWVGSLLSTGPVILFHGGVIFIPLALVVAMSITGGALGRKIKSNQKVELTENPGGDF